MSRLPTVVSLLSGCVLAGVCFAQAPVPSATPRTTTTPAPKKVSSKVATAPSKGRIKAKKRKPPVEEAVAPPRPLTPEQLPPTRPSVSYRNGQLSIVANNSTMTDVLNSVRAPTGAQFEMTGVSSADRVYARLGPGAPKDILAALLDGSRFNFAILGSPTDPAAVQRVVLMPKAGGASGPTPAVASNPAGSMGRPGPRQVTQQPDEEQPNEEEAQPEEAPAEEQAQPEQQQQQPGQVKTPEQLLQELQQMQQQQQQQQNPNGQPQDPQQPPQIPDEQNPQ